MHPQSKNPVGVDWPRQGKSREEALAAKGNLGFLPVLESGVMDVDLDSPDAKALAEVILPQTFAKFDLYRLQLRITDPDLTDQHMSDNLLEVNSTLEKLDKFCPLTELVNN